MPPPDFNKKTTLGVAKRAAYKCSNPDCRVSTVGPNSDPEKSIVIGEAAHIFGARLGSKRYSSSMTDVARAEITNAIWLCRNCHKIIDSDGESYSANVLFAWRESHERYVLSELGTAGDKIRFEEHQSTASAFESCPPLIRRIVADKPNGWEFRLTAELMRHLNSPHLRRLNDLRNGLYVNPLTQVRTDEIFDWVRVQLDETSSLAEPITNLLKGLVLSWGKPGVAGDASEIFHACCLIRDYLKQVVNHEERIYFSRVPEDCERLKSMLKDLLGSQAEKLAGIPSEMDRVVELIGMDHGGTDESPTVIEKVITYEWPEGLNRQLNWELKRAAKRQSAQQGSIGCGGCLVLVILALLVFMAF